MDRGGREVGMENRDRNMGHEEEEEEEVKMELELDAAHALANLAGSDPNQSSVSQEEDPHHLQARSEETSNESKGNRCRKNRTVDKTGNANNSVNPAEVSSTARGQKNLSEAERDAKRLRRILANRESARQTILRRQAFRDELARKVSILSAENLVLKKEKENAAREYSYQKEMNQQLKEQMQMTPLKEEKTISQPPLSVPEMPGTPRTPACAAHSAAAEVSCSLTLGFGTTKDETVEEKKYEAMIFGKRIKNPLLLECEWKEGSCKTYPPLDAANARRRRMEIARIKQMNRS